MFDFIALIYCLVPLGTVSLGIQKFYLELANNSTPSLNLVFYYFQNKSNFIRSVIFSFNLSIRIAAIWSLYVLPGVILLIISSYKINSNPDVLTPYNFAIGFAVVMIIAGILFALYRSLRYIMAPYFFVSDDENSIMSCIVDSQRCMKKCKKYFIWLFILFIPLAESCFFVLPVLYFLPYLQASNSVLSKWIMLDYYKNNT
jgi:hypothetical protein